MGEWKEYKIKNLGLVVTGKTPSSKFPEEFGFDMPFITPSDYKYYGKWAEYSDRGLSKNGVKKLQNKILPIGSVLVTCIGSDMGKVVLNKVPVITNQQINSIIPNQNLVTTDFLYYKIIDCYETLRMYGQAGSAVPIVNKGDFEEIILEVPEDIEEQKSIASILSSLDDKIDLLHRRNKTLEALAETLFRQWFVEEVEEGWEVVKVKDVCKTITKGTTPTTLGNSFTETGVNFLKAESLTDDGDLLENKFAHIDEATNEKLSRSKIEVNDLIITIAGTIGRVAIVPERILPANSNQALAILRLAENTISHIFLYCLFKTTEVRNDFESRVVHAVQPNLSLSEIGDIAFKLPSKEKLSFGEKELGLIFQKKEKNNIQIRTLTRLRDTLLPKLMSGEVRIQLPLPPSLTKEGEIRLKEK